MSRPVGRCRTTTALIGGCPAEPTGCPSRPSPASGATTGQRVAADTGSSVMTIRNMAEVLELAWAGSDVDKGARIASRSVAAREARPPLLNPRKREPFLHKKARGRASPESEKSSTQSVPRRASASTSTGVVRWFATHHKRSDEGPEVFFSNNLASYPPAGAGGGAAEHRHGVRVRSQQHRLPQVLLDDQRLTPSL